MIFRKHIKKFSEDCSGVIAVIFAISLVAFFALAAFVYDVGRVGVSHAELQSFADSVALASAGELDGSSDAITRATAAAAAMISDTSKAVPGGATLAGASDYTLTFLNGLPASDTASMATFATSNPAEAWLVHVAVTPQTVPTVFTNVALGLLGNAATTANVTAEAVAGFTVEACDITPMMFCLPSPSYSANANIGNQILLRSGGQGAAWGPGDFGFLDPSQADLGSTCAGLTGVNVLLCLVGAEQNVTKCFTQRGVDIEPGQKVGIEDAAFNIRFDIYKSTMNGKKNDPDYPPAPNTISGIMPNGGGNCIGGNEQPSTDTMALPRDDCFGLGTCTRYGNGNWDYDNYIDTNHGNGNGVLDAGEDSHLTAFPQNASYAGTRFELYLQEIEYGDSGALPQNDIMTGNAYETGRPQCSNNMSTDPFRRVIIAAGVDCTANPINGAATGVPVQEYFQIFLTEAVGDDGLSPPTLDMWGEIIGSAGGSGGGAAGSGGIFRDVVQLYR